MPISLEELAKKEEEEKKKREEFKEELKALVEETKEHLKKNIKPNMAYTTEEIDDLIKDFLFQKTKEKYFIPGHPFFTPFFYPRAEINKMFDEKSIGIIQYYVLKKPEEEKERR